jgi:hypothetical protein
MNVSAKWNKQFTFALLLVVVFMIKAFYLWGYSIYIFFGLIFGFLIGFFLQRSRFCFASGFRDIFMIRNGSMTRALIILLLVNSIGFFILHISGIIDLIDSGALQPVGLNTFIGGLLFGFGLILAGSCVSGCLMRMGEGYAGQWVVFVGIMVGSYLPSLDFGHPDASGLNYGRIIFIPDYLGWHWTIIVYIVILALLYYLVVRYEGLPRGKVIRPGSGRVNIAGNVPGVVKSLFVGRPINYYYGAFLLALLHLVMLPAWGRTASIIYGVSGLSGWVLNQASSLFVFWPGFMEWIQQRGDPDAWTNPVLYFAVSIIIGSASSSLLNGEFRVRFPRKPPSYIYALSGGFLLGFSANMAAGCNFGAFWSGISSFSLHGWVFGLFIIIGSLLGGKLYMRYLI